MLNFLKKLLGIDSKHSKTENYHRPTPVQSTETTAVLVSETTVTTHSQAAQVDAVVATPETVANQATKPAAKTAKKPATKSAAKTAKKPAKK